ncbi:hypothetical protein MRX96_008155 [Rhipicephalus microplus]
MKRTIPVFVSGCDCVFEEALERNTRDCFIIGLCEKKVQRLLLAKPRSLTLKDALDNALAAEFAISNTSRLPRSSNTPAAMVATGMNVLEQKKRHGNQKASRLPGKKLSCLRCGEKSQALPECPHKNTTSATNVDI